MTDASEDAIEIVMCARYGEIEELQELLKTSGLPISSTDNRGNTAFHMAAANGHDSILLFLLDGSNSTGDQELVDIVNMPNEEGNTALHWCALNGHVKCVELLLEAGARPDTKNKADLTPTFVAQQAGHEDVVSAIMKITGDDSKEPEAEEEDEEEERTNDDDADVEADVVA